MASTKCFLIGLMLLGYCLFIDASVPRSCRQVQVINKQTTDGEYCISVDGSETKGSMIYCHGMGTNDPSEYLTLPRGPEENLSFTQKNPSCSTGRIMYEKLGLNLEAMVVNSWDNRFTIMENVDHTLPWCDSQALYGRAFSCPSPNGVVKVDLRDTAFYIPETVTWEKYGYVPRMYVSVSTSQTFNAECTGYCGGCQPKNADGGFNYGGALHNNTLAIAYDISLDSNACHL